MALLVKTIFLVQQLNLFNFIAPPEVFEGIHNYSIIIFISIQSHCLVANCSVTLCVHVYVYVCLSSTVKDGINFNRYGSIQSFNTDAIRMETGRAFVCE